MSEQNIKAEELKTSQMEITESELMDNEAIEQAYKAQMLTEIPDLWNRIEAALPEKTPSETFQRNAAPIKTDSKKKDSKAVIFRYVKSAALIAAGICILLMVPMLLSVSNSGMKSADAEFSASPGASYAIPPAEEEAPAEEAAPAEEEPAPAEEAAPAEEEEPTMATAEAPVMEEEASAEDTTENKNLFEETKSDTDMTNGSEEQKQAEKRGEFNKDALYTEGVRIEVVSQGTTEAKSDDGYYLFTVMILEDASGMYTVGDTCDVYADEALSKDLKPESKHTVTIVNPQPASSSQLELYILDEATIDNQ